MIKAQHPDYELYMTSIHYKRGVACADCHMPYINEGGQKFSDHHIQSPLNNISSSCLVCHREETQDLIDDVYSRQDKIKEISIRFFGLNDRPQNRTPAILRESPFFGDDRRIRNAQDF